MNKNTLKVFVIITIILTIISIHYQFAIAQTKQCLDIVSDLKSGSSGSVVKSLQQYLFDEGYLNATPNGYFGPATLSAVKRFQLQNNISNTGMIGPMTRTLIKNKTCGTDKAVDNSSSNVSTIHTQSIISSPKNGDHLTINDKINILFSTKINYPHDIVLEYPNGAGAGYIGRSLMNENFYEWKIGRIYNAGTNQYENVATGTYRIRIRKNSGIGSSVDDPISELFVLTEPALSLSSVYPTSAVADGIMATVVFGEGFDDSSIVRFDGSYGAIAHKLYTSTDGRVMVFTIPTGISSGMHSIVVDNNYGMISNSINIFVTK